MVGALRIPLPVALPACNDQELGYYCILSSTLNTGLPQERDSHSPIQNERLVLELMCKVHLRIQKVEI